MQDAVHRHIAAAEVQAFELEQVVSGLSHKPCHVTPTLLVNSKTPRKAILHPTLKGQRDRGCCVEQCTPMLLEIQQLRLNQQIQRILYAGAELNRLYPGCSISVSNHAV